MTGHRTGNDRQKPGCMVPVLPVYLFTAFFVIIPFIYALFLSFMTRTDSWDIGYVFTLKNYTDIFNPVFLPTLATSIQTAVIVTMLCILIGYPAGLFTAGFDKRLRSLFLTGHTMPFWINSLIRLYGWVILLRSDGLFGALNILYSYPGVIVGMVYVLLPFMIYSVYAAAVKLEPSALEASRVLGASPVTAFFTVTLPLTAKGLLTGVTLTFIPSMGLFVVSDILGGGKTVVFGNIIEDQINKVRNLPFAAALSIFLMVLTGAVIALSRLADPVENVRRASGNSQNKSKHASLGSYTRSFLYEHITAIRKKSPPGLFMKKTLLRKSSGRGSMLPKRKSLFPLIYMILLTVITWLPVLVVIIYSFNDSRIASVWNGFSFRWYKELFNDSSMLLSLINSLILGAASAIIGAVIAVSAALSFRSFGGGLTRFTKAALMIPVIIPEIILGVVYLAFFKLLKLPFGMLTLIIAHTAFSIPYIYLQTATRVASMDVSPAEAARVAGAGPVRAFFDVTLPYLLPAVLSGMFLSFAMSFDDVIISMFVTGVSVNTLPLKVYSQIKTGSTPKINALCTIMLIVTIIFSAIKHHFTKGDVHNDTYT